MQCWKSRKQPDKDLLGFDGVSLFGTTHPSGSKLVVPAALWRMIMHLAAGRPETVMQQCSLLLTRGTAEELRQT